MSREMAGGCTRRLLVISYGGINDQFGLNVNHVGIRWLGIVVGGARGSGIGLRKRRSVGHRASQRFLNQPCGVHQVTAACQLRSFEQGLAEKTGHVKLSGFKPAPRCLCQRGLAGQHKCCSAAKDTPFALLRYQQAGRTGPRATTTRNRPTRKAEANSRKT